MGTDPIFLQLLAEAGFSIAFHAKPVVRAKADCALTYSGPDPRP
jgi:phosphoserine phosphatase